MRNLTITRKKSFVASLAAMKVYIEDPSSVEIDINGIRCRKLGVLKNGSSATFEIPEEALKVFVIFDSASKEYCNDCYQLPEGSDDITLTGKNKYNPALGNAFVFDNNTTVPLVTKKKKSAVGTIVFVASIVIGIFVGLAASGVFNIVRPKTFTYQNFSVTLTSAFEKVGGQSDNYDVAYDSSDVAVLVLKEEKSLFKGHNLKTVDDYLELSIDVNAKKTTVKHKDGLSYFEYTTKSENGKITYNWYAFGFEDENAFWLVQFTSDRTNKTEEIFDFAKSVSIG